MPKSHLTNPHGCETGSAAWAARREDCGAVVSHKRRVTQQRARRVASRTGFGAQAWNHAVASLANDQRHWVRLAPRLQARAPKRGS